MPPDNDAKMLEILGDALTSLQVKYRASNLADRMLLRPTLEQLLHDYVAYQIRLLKEGVITTDEDLQEMKSIQQDIDRAASQQKLIASLARTVAFVATKI